MSKMLSLEEILRYKIDNNVVDFLVVTGSRLYGTNIPESDKDLRGFIVPPYDYLIGLKTFNDMDVKGADHKIYSLKRWMDLASSGDPQCLEMLFVPNDKIIKITRVGTTVLENRSIFLSKKIFYRIAGYSNSEWRKAQGVKLVPAKRTTTEDQVVADIRNVYKPDKATMDQIILLLEANRETKLISSTRKLGAKRKKEFEKYGYGSSSAAHAIRLLSEVQELLLTGHIDFPRPDCDLLKRIRYGQLKFSKIEKIYEKEREKAEMALEKSILPDKPDKKAIDDLYLTIIYKDFVKPV